MKIPSEFRVTEFKYSDAQKRSVYDEWEIQHSECQFEIDIQDQENVKKSVIDFVQKI